MDEPLQNKLLNLAFSSAAKLGEQANLAPNFNGFRLLDPNELSPMEAVTTSGLMPQVGGKPYAPMAPSDADTVARSVE